VLFKFIRCHCEKNIPSRISHTVLKYFFLVPSIKLKKAFLRGEGFFVVWLEDAV
jgi:hypothetical protein